MFLSTDSSNHLSTERSENMYPISSSDKPPEFEDMAKYVRENFLYEFFDYVIAVEPELIRTYVEGGKDFYDWFER